MIEVLLRLAGLLMLAGGALMGSVGVGEYGRAADAPGAYGAQLALQFRIDVTDAALLLGVGLLCLGMAAVVGVTTSHWERGREPTSDPVKALREVEPELELPDPHSR